MKKPSWLNKKIDFEKCIKVKRILRKFNLHTICEEAMCPNISECFFKKAVSFLLLGNVCSYNCKFCAVKKGKPLSPDTQEPKNIARVVKLLGIKGVVLTSVCRPDLEDEGLSQFLKTIKEIRKLTPQVLIEVLIPNFSQKSLIDNLIKEHPQIIAHNLETVERLHPSVKKGTSYKDSLKLLKLIKEKDKTIFTKSGLLLGIGEKPKEVIKTLIDLRKVNCDFLSLGQCLRPSPEKMEVKEYLPLEKFNFYREKALELGFKHVESSPYVRSSYKVLSYFS